MFKICSWQGASDFVQDFRNSIQLEAESFLEKTFSLLNILFLDVEICFGSLNMSGIRF